jgi:hypothetical protein
MLIGPLRLRLRYAWKNIFRTLPGDEECTGRKLADKCFLTKTSCKNLPTNVFHMKPRGKNLPTNVFHLKPRGKNFPTNVFLFSPGVFACRRIINDGKSFTDATNVFAGRIT